MGKATGFKEYERVNIPDRDVKERTGDWKEFHLDLPEEDIKIQAARCMDCGIPFCHMGTILNGSTSGCPIHNIIPDFNDMVYKGQWEAAYEILSSTNNFPEFTGRVCPAPCEGSCTLGIINPSVNIKQIEKQIIEKAFSSGWVKAEIPTRRSNKKVAVIGSGPSGLACAAELNKLGHNVTVYERADKPGGLLMYGIPSMKLDKKIVQRRINLMEKEGIKFITNTEAGKDISAEKLLSKYDAVVLCIGSTLPRALSQDGKDLKGIYYAMDFLTNNTKQILDCKIKNPDYISAKNKNVIVIGGGDTGTDCVATSIRQGCKSVHQFEILPSPPMQRAENNPWPEWPRILLTDYGQEEAKELFGKDPREFVTMTTKIVGDENNNVKELHTSRIEWKKENGTFTYSQIPDSKKIWKADLVFLAMGFIGPESHILDELGIEQDERSNIRTEQGKFQTNKENIFAAGDARRGQSLVVWAINEGRSAALDCHEYLSN